jgi:SAM-dependent methyltransferase
MPYENHFSDHAHAYARHRPRYPNELFAWFRSVANAHELAWDAGTGNGQVAAALAGFMARVVATDASSEQLSHAEPHERVEYRAEPSDSSSLETASVDLVTAGAAAHWFELDGFYREVRRVAKPGAVIALFSYGPRDIAAAVSPVVHTFQEEVLAGFWPERIKYVHDRYASLPFPFEEIPAPSFTMTAEWDLDDLVAFLETWSASQRYLQQVGERATKKVERALIEAWGDPAVSRTFRFPLFLRAGRA